MFRPTVASLCPACRNVRGAAGVLSAVWGYVRQMASTWMFYIMGLLSSPVCWVLWKVAGERIPARSGQKFIRWLFRVYLRWMRFTGTLDLKVIGMDALDRLRGTIIVANHPALLDVVLLTSVLPPTACVMRASLLRNPALCGCALLARYVSNDSGPALVRQGIDKIRSGQNLLIFPEGSRTVSSEVNPFKVGFALIAVRTGAPVQTVLIEHPGRHLTKGVSLFSTTDLPLHFTVKPGELLSVREGESPRDFSRRVEDWFRSRLENSEAGITIRDPDPER